MKISVLILTFVILTFGAAFAEPTPQNKKFLWEHDGMNVAGFWLYYAPEAELPVRVYSNARRVQLPGALVREVAILSSGIGDGKWCGKVTAFNADGMESGFSEEACGNFFQLSSAFGMGVE